nr:MAG TPA: hypothetical protein [Caudoviricetes sp.]
MEVRIKSNAILGRQCPLCKGRNNHMMGRQRK